MAMVRNRDYLEIIDMSDIASKIHAFSFLSQVCAFAVVRTPLCEPRSQISGSHSSREYLVSS
jgi:hypothetical protein